MHCFIDLQIDAVSSATTLGYVKTELGRNSPLDAALAQAFDLLNGFSGFMPGSLGETSAILVLLEGLVGKRHAMRAGALLHLLMVFGADLFTLLSGFSRTHPTILGTLFLGHELAAIDPILILHLCLVLVAFTSTVCG